MQYPDDPEDPSATCGDESDPEQEDEADAHGAGANGDEANKEETGSNKQGEAGSGADDDVEAGSGADDDVEAGSDADDDFEADIQEDEDDVRAAGTDGGDDDDEASDADEEADADPAENRRANLVVAASLLLAAIVTVTATVYAPPPPITPSAHRQGPMPITFPTGEVTFSTIHNIPRGGTGIANDNHQKWNGYHTSSINFQVGLGPRDDNRPQLSALIPRFLSVVFTSFLHVFYFWHQLGVLDLVMLPLVWVLMGVIILYHG